MTADGPAATAGEPRLVDGPSPAYEGGQLIHDVFRARAAADPAAPALIHRGVRVSYGQLDRLSDALAAELSRRQVGPGQLVAVLRSRSPELVVSLLAVLKAGAGYAAIDPTWPDKRIRELVERLDPPLVIAGADQATRVAGPVHLLGDLPSLPAGTGALDLPAPRLDGSDVSTVFLTSGSTGRPKVVLSPHRATVRLLAQPGFARFDPTTVMPVAAPTPWDAFSLELWGPLLGGGTCVLVDQPYLQPAVLREVIERDGVNTAWITASLFNVLIDEDPAAFRGLRLAMIGGERLSGSHVRRFLQAHPQIALVNGYGPVESTVFATTHRITLADTAGAGIPLGRPVPGTAVGVFTGEHPCQPGEVGEVCVFGAGLAAGYLGDPALTAQKFVEVQVAGRRQRMYRTGDFGRLDADGVLHFVGRRDRQVKVRGHRVEPDEIEQHLLAAAGVTAAVVVPVRDATGACTKLAAFYTAGPDGPAARELTEQLRGQLPGYLVPEIVRQVERMPLSANGKADHAQLLATLTAPDAASSDAGPAEPPTDPLERAIAAEFAELLGVAAVDRHAGFFDAGGSSLDALRLCARLAQRLGRAVPQSVLAAAPTVAGLAGWLHGRAAESAPALQWSDQTGVPLLPMQRAFWLASMLEPASAATHCASVWRTRGVDAEVLVRAARDVHRRHPGLRARIVLTDVPMAIVPHDAAPLVVTELGPMDDPLAGLLARLHEPFDLARGVVCHAAVAADRSTGELLFGLAVHHAFYDGWSEVLLAADLSTAVAARRAGHAPRFDEPAPSLAAVYACQQAQRAVADLDAQRAYWREKLAGASRLAALAPDTHAPARPLPEPAIVTVPGPAVSTLAAAAERVGASRSQALLAVFAEAVRSVTSAPDIVLGVAVANRGHPTLQAAVGCLFDTVCVRLRQVGAGLAATTAECRDEMIGALRNQDLSVGEITELVGADAARGRPPYDALFVLQQGPLPRLGAAEPVPVWQPTSRELVAEARPQADGSVVFALLAADQPGPRAVATDLATAIGRLVRS